MISLISFRKFSAVMGNWEAVRTNGAWADATGGRHAPGWCLGSLPRLWRKPRLMNVPYYAFWMIERGQRKGQSEKVEARTLKLGAVVTLPKRHLDTRVGTSEPPAIPQPQALAGLLLPCITCHVPLSSFSWLYSWGYHKAEFHLSSEK